MLNLPTKKNTQTMLKFTQNTLRTTSRSLMKKAKTMLMRTVTMKTMKPKFTMNIQMKKDTKGMLTLKPKRPFPTLPDVLLIQ